MRRLSGHSWNFTIAGEKTPSDVSPSAGDRPTPNSADLCQTSRAALIRSPSPVQSDVTQGSLVSSAGSTDSENPGCDGGSGSNRRNSTNAASSIGMGGQQHMQQRPPIPERSHRTIISSNSPQPRQQPAARIAALEHELAMLKTNHQRELECLSAAASTSASFWEAQQATTLRQIALAEKEARQARTERETVWRELQVCENEARRLRGQVEGMKEWVSTSTRVDGDRQITDDVFAEAMATLGNELQNWVLGWFRKVKIDFANASADVLAGLEFLVPTYEELVAVSKAHLLQSFVSRLIVDAIFNAYFVGLSEDQVRKLAAAEATIASVAPPSSLTQYRSQTLALLQKEAFPALQSETNILTDRLLATTNNILNSFTTPPTAPGHRDDALRILLASAIDLSRLLRIQRGATFTTVMPKVVPHQRTLFDPQTMQDVGGEEADDEALTHREVCCVAFPGLVKVVLEDFAGESRVFQRVLVKARVLCSPE